MSWDGRGIVRFPVGCVRSSAFGVVFSSVIFLYVLALLLDPVLFAWLALEDADLIDADSLEWELAGVVTFRIIGVVFCKGHLLAFILVSAGSGVVFIVAGRLRAEESDER